MKTRINDINQSTEFCYISIEFCISKPACIKNNDKTNSLFKIFECDGKCIGKVNWLTSAYNAGFVADMCKIDKLRNVLLASLC